MKRLWLSASAQSLLIDEATRKYPLETGGILIGYISEDRQIAVVQHVVGPGIGAEHGRDYFVPDYVYHKYEAGRFYDESRGRLTYLGDWHSHPQGRPKLSVRDKNAMNNIADYQFNYNATPCMLVLSGAITKWDISAWVVLKKAGWLSNIYVYRKLIISRFDDRQH